MKLILLICLVVIICATEIPPSNTTATLTSKKRDLGKEIPEDKNTTEAGHEIPVKVAKDENTTPKLVSGDDKADPVGTNKTSDDTAKDNEQDAPAGVEDTSSQNVPEEPSAPSMSEGLDTGKDDSGTTNKEDTNADTDVGDAATNTEDKSDPTGGDGVGENVDVILEDLGNSDVEPSSDPPRVADEPKYVDGMMPNYDPTVSHILGVLSFGFLIGLTIYFYRRRPKRRSTRYTSLRNDDYEMTNSDNARLLDEESNSEEERDVWRSDDPLHK